MFPGKECRIPAFMALHRVDIAGEKRFAWKKVMRAADVVLGTERWPHGTV